MTTTDHRRSRRLAGGVGPAASNRAGEKQSGEKQSGDKQVGPGRGPLVVTADLDLLDHVLAAAAAAGVEPTVVDDPVAARASWRTQEMVIVGEDRARQLAQLALPRRAEVFLVGVEAARDELDRWSAPLGAAVVVLPDSSAWLTTAISDVTGRSARGGLVLSVIGGCGGVGHLEFGGGSRGRRRSPGHRHDAGRPRSARGRDRSADGRRRQVGLALGPAALCPGTRGGPERPPATGRGVGVLASDRGPDGDAPIGIDAVRSVLTSAARHHRLVVLDLPREASAASREALRCSDQAVLLAGSDVRGVAAGRQQAGRLRETLTPVSAVVRVARGGGIDPQVVAETLGLELLAVLGEDPVCGGPPRAVASRRGVPRSALAKTSQAVLESVGSDPQARRVSSGRADRLDQIRTALVALGRPHNPADVAEVMRAEGHAGQRFVIVRDGRGAAPGERGGRAARSAVGGSRVSPTSWSTAPGRCSSTEGRAWRTTGDQVCRRSQVRKLAQRLAASVVAGSTTPRRSSTPG